MWFLSLLRQSRSGAIAAAAALLAAEAAGQTANGFDISTNAAPKSSVTLQAGELVGHEQVIRQFIRIGTNEFVFVLPAGLRRDSTPDGMTVLTSGDMSYYLSLRIAAPSPAHREALQEQIASQYAAASGLEEYTAWVADREGTGFQLRQDVPRVGSRLIRILWVPFKAGVMEFALNADAKSAAAGQAALDMILLTFRSNERGRLEIVERSDKS